MATATLTYQEIPLLVTIKINMRPLEGSGHPVDNNFAILFITMVNESYPLTQPSLRLRFMLRTETRILASWPLCLVNRIMPFVHCNEYHQVQTRPPLLIPSFLPLNWMLLLLNPRYSRTP